MSYDAMPENNTNEVVIPTTPKAVPPMFAIPRNERIEKVNKLRELSKEIFGRSSRWRKILDEGVPTVLTRQVVNDNPEGTEDTYTEVPVMENGLEVRYIKRYTLDSLLEYLSDIKTKRDEIMAKIKEMQAEANAKAKSDAAVSEALNEAKGSAHGGL